MNQIPYLDLPAQIRGIRKDLDAAIARTLDHCSFCLGPDVTQFEKDFAKYIGAEHCVAWSRRRSRYHAVHVRCHELGDFLCRCEAGLRGH